VLQWAHANGCPWDVQTCAVAAAGGHLSLLRWAHETGCPWDESTCTKAAENVQLRSLAWAIQHGCTHLRQANGWAAAQAIGQGQGHTHSDGPLTLGAQAVLHVISLVKGRMAAMAMPH
jgi:hypothetical protein